MDDAGPNRRRDLHVLLPHPPLDPRRLPREGVVRRACSSFSSSPTRRSGWWGTGPRPAARELDVLHAPVVSAWPDPRDAGAVVALGSDRSVHASKRPVDRAPRWPSCARRTRPGVPVLGICFGGQALAAALGATVSRAAETEIGWVDVEGDDGVRRALVHLARGRLRPPAGRHRAGDAPRSGPQAFAAGASVGLQFHPEVTPAIVDDWLAGARDEVPDAEPIRAETARTRGAGPRARLRADGPHCCPLAALTVRHVSINGPLSSAQRPCDRWTVHASPPPRHRRSARRARAVRAGHRERRRLRRQRTSCPAAGNVSAVGQATLCLLNQQRAAHGLGALVENAKAEQRLDRLLAADGRAGLLQPPVAGRRHAGPTV